MAKVRGFLLSHFGRTYFLIFLPFFSILSIVYIIKISILSNQITLGVADIFKLFNLFLPEIMFYTIPISFIIAISSTFNTLSKDSELTALFSFGFSPLGIFKTFLMPAFLFSTLMLLISLYSIPKNILAFEQYKIEQLQKAKFTVEPNKLGQKFGNYFLFTDSKKGDTLSNLVLFAKNKKSRLIFISEQGSIHNHDGNFMLSLDKGKGDTFLSDRIESLSYQTMHIYPSIRQSSSQTHMQWSFDRIRKHPKEMAWLTYYIFLSLSPLLSFGIIIALSTKSARYQNTSTYLTAFFTILILYTLSAYLQKSGTPTALLSIVLFFVLLSSFFYKRLSDRF